MSYKKRSNANPHSTSNLHRQQSQKTTKSVVNKTPAPEKISYSVAHAIAGRIRFRIPRLAVDSEYADKLKRVIEADSRITNVRINQTAACIVINYQPSIISDEQMRSHLVDLIQIAPTIVLPTPVTAKSIAKAIFDAVLNLIDSTRNINQAHNAIAHGEFRTNTWERVLSGTKTAIKGIKSAIMFVLPNKQWRSQNSKNKFGLQPEDSRLALEIAS